MAQSDQVVQNATFPAVRADINDNLAALFSQSSGPSAPAVTAAYQPWIDTSSSPAVWKVRNGTNTGWITVGTIDATTFAAGGITPIANGGTGETTASGAINALVPSQAGNADKYLTTDGSAVSWAPAYGSVAYEYTSNNTWNKPAEGTFALVTIWGGGGSGGRNTYAGGGGGGACVQRLYRLSELPSSVAITIGAGGAGRSTAGDGSPGGTTTFGSLLSAYGGGAGDNSSSLQVNGGGGGGSLSAGANGGSGATGGNGHGPSLTGGNTGVKADFGGGGGGSSSGSTRFGGSAYWGGGGGGGREDSTSKSGGVSLHGGNGGASNSSSAGGFPGGGSGGTNATTGAGGAGYCLIYVW